MKRVCLSFLVGTLAGAAVGTLVGLVTADPNDPRQQTLREIVRQIYKEARRAAEEQESRLREEYKRMTGL